MKVEQTRATNSNPVFSVAKDGTVLYANKADEPLLHEWDVRVGGKLPPSILDLVQRVISRSSPEKMEVKVGKRVYLVVFHPSPEQECASISGFDISDQIKLEGELQESEDPEMPNLELSEIIDAHAIQSLMDDFYKLSHIPMGLDDINGKTLVSIGWQDICTKFHRVHPDTCKQCFESNKILSSGIHLGEIKQYKCMNDMWDIATPIIVDGQHIGNIFAGQFFYEDEPIDYELFRSRARRYGFNEGEYIEALEKVPRLSREAVNTGISFLMNLGNMISQLSYGNIKLTQSLVKRDILVEALRVSEEKFRQMAENIEEVFFIFTPDWKQTIYVSPAYERIWGRPQKDVYDNPMAWLEWVHPDDRGLPLAVVNKHIGGNITGIDAVEFRVLRTDGALRWVLSRTYPVLDEQGSICRITGIAEDITESKLAEEVLKKAHEMLEVKVKERTKELEEAYKLLKESEENLAEAQKIAHIGNWDWNVITNEFYWSDEIYRIFGRNPQEFNAAYDAFLSYVHSDDREYVSNAIIEALEGKAYSIDHRIILANGEESIVHGQGKVFFDEENVPIRMIGTIQDITERKRAEVEYHRAEERYRIVTEQTGHLVYDNNLDSNVVFWAGAIEEIFGYNLKEVKNFNLEDWIEHIHPEDRKFVLEKFTQARKLGGRNYVEYRIRKKNGTYIYIGDTGTCLKNKDGKTCRVLGVVKDITLRKQTEETLARIEISRQQEIHHRIKNNLQIISSLLDLQAEKFKGKSNIKDSQVLEAFQESQDRVISMALIHEELYEGGGFDTLNLHPYIHKLAENLLQTYRLGNNEIALSMDLEENPLFNMDTAVPLGIIVNELVSNSHKYAFAGRDKGEIKIELHREENGEYENKDYKCTRYTLIISDNGVGVPEDLNIEDLDSLGLQLVTTLVDQLDGELELKRSNGTEFIIKFTVTEKDKQASAIIIS